MLQPSPKKIDGDGLQVHLVRVVPEVLAADRPPLLGKHANEELLREVAYHRHWAQAAICPGP